MKREGWGIGALVSYSSYRGNSAIIGMITDINWDKLDFRIRAENNTDEAFVFRKLDCVMSQSWNGRETFRYPPDAYGQATENDRKFGWSTEIAVLSRLTPEAIEAQIPDGWTTDANPKAMLASIFDDTARHNVYDWKNTNES
jgi:hypothetical protein